MSAEFIVTMRKKASEQPEGPKGRSIVAQAGGLGLGNAGSRVKALKGRTTGA